MRFLFTLSVCVCVCVCWCGHVTVLLSVQRFDVCVYILICPVCVYECFSWNLSQRTPFELFVELIFQVVRFCSEAYPVEGFQHKVHGVIFCGNIKWYLEINWKCFRSWFTSFRIKLEYHFFKIITSHLIDFSKGFEILYGQKLNFHKSLQS